MDTPPIPPSPPCPAAVEYADPFERQGTQSGLVGAALRSLLTVECTGPERLIDCLSRPLNERLAKEGRALPAPVHPMFLAAALRDRRDAGIPLQFRGVLEAITLLAEGGKQPGSELRACPW